MLFVSCDMFNLFGDRNEDSEGTTEEQTEPTDVIEDILPDYSSIAADWNNYIEFNAPESVPVLNPSDPTFITADQPSDNVQVNTNGKFIMVTTTTENSVNSTNESYNTRSIRYEIYNSTTGEEIFNATVPAYRVGTEDPAYKYSFEFLNAMFEVRKQIYGKNPEENAYPEYVYTSYYSYYDQNGEILAANLDSRSYSSSQTETGDLAITVGEKCYVIRDGEIFYTFDKGQERPLPTVDFEYLDYKYQLKNDTYRVFDSDCDLIAKYSIPYGSDDCMHTVLSNGNIFVQLIYNLDESAKDYDFSKAKNKYDVTHIIFDVTTGKATALELDFVVANIVTNAVDDGSNITVKNNNQFAEVYKIVNDKLSSDCSFLILDNNMKEVKELQSFLKNQTVGTGFATSGKLLVTAKAAGYGEDTMHVVDLEAKEINDFTKDCMLIENGIVVYDDYGYDYSNGYYCYGGTLYSYDFEEIYDLADADRYTVYENSILVIESSTDSHGSTTYYYSVIATDGTSYSENRIASAQYTGNVSISYDYNFSCYIVRNSADGMVGIYNCNGVNIASGSSADIIGSSENGVTVKVSDPASATDYYYFFKY